MKVLNNVSMKNYTTYKTGGIIKSMYFPINKNELIDLIKKLKEENTKFFVIGNGSNLIIDDNDFNGAIINLKEMNTYEIKDNEIICDCGVMMPMLANMVIKESYKGLEWAISIPGTIGGCIYNNAGAYNSAMQDIIKTVTVLDENYNIIDLNNEKCHFTYRDSVFKKEKKYIILSCTLKIEKYNQESLLELVEDRKQRRLASQPLEYPSAGSVFRNPEIAPAGKLIEDLGLKGTTIGGAQISEKHANFIVNIGNATSQDIKDLIELIKDKVRKQYNVELILEQEILNWE